MYRTIIFSLLLLIFHASPLPFPSLLSIHCIPASHQPFAINNTTKTLLENLTNEAQKTHFATSKTNQFTGLMQCRLDLNQPSCFFCIKHAKDTILRPCPSSKTLEAWFHGCYLEYYQNKIKNNNQVRVTKVLNLSGTETGTDSQTVTGTGIENDNFMRFKGGFGCWDIHKYPNGDVSGTKNDNCSKLPCIIVLNHSCFSKVAGQCLVCLKTNSKFIYSNIPQVHSGLRSRNTIVIVEDGGGNNVGHVKREILLLCGVGIAILATVGICGYLVRRSIVNSAKVVGVSGNDGDKV